MTPQQSKALTYIRSYIAANGYAPSVREISSSMGHASPSSAHRLVELLIDEGHLIKRSNVKRGLALPNSDVAKSLDARAIAARIIKRLTEAGNVTQDEDDDLVVVEAEALRAIIEEECGR